VADYKSTAKTAEATIDGDWQISYKRQVELYQWLLRERGFPVADSAWFVYANGNSAAETFNARLEFRVTLLRHDGDTSWVAPALQDIKKLLESPAPPPPGEKCGHCKYLAAAEALHRNGEPQP
jgi:CRISPR/Cas system-associated exonuclease Cas4 (RecB family)